MAKYTQQQAADMIDNTTQSPGEGWKQGEVFCEGCKEAGPDGEPIIVGKGWRFDMWNFQGRPLEILIDLPENATEATRHSAAKAEIQTLDVLDCDAYPPS